MPIAVVVFMSGMIVLLVGAVRGLVALRTAQRSSELRHALPAVGWSALSIYGLVLASAGMLLAR